MKRTGLVLLFFALALSSLAAQQKYALVIGNGAYTGITRLNNPVNDAGDMKTTLQGMGFTVDTVLNGSRVQMEEGIERFRNRLAGSKSSYGFLFYAGHGIQSGGINYLIPVDADIRSESYLPDRAVSVQAMLDELNAAGNSLNIVVLDACRDNPFGWRRSGTRGLQVVSNQPADSIIVYATSAGSTAADGTGRNGLFTTHLLNNLKKPGLSVRDMFDQTGADVRRASGGAQIPAIYSQFFDVAYLGTRPQTVQPAAPPAQPTPTPGPAPAVTADAKTYYDRGNEYYNKNDYDRAIAEFTEAIRINPTYADAYNNRGVMYERKGDYDRAFADYDQTIRFNPNPARAYRNRGGMYERKGDYDRAIADYDQAIRLDPNYARAYRGRGVAYYNKNDYDRAIADYTQAIRLDPSYAIAYNSRGNAYYMKSDYNRAIADYEAALRLDPNFTNAREFLEKCLVATQKLADEERRLVP